VVAENVRHQITSKFKPGDIVFYIAIEPKRKTCSYCNGGGEMIRPAVNDCLDDETVVPCVVCNGSGEVDVYYPYVDKGEITAVSFVQSDLNTLVPYYHINDGKYPADVLYLDADIAQQEVIRQIEDLEYQDEERYGGYRRGRE